MIPLNIEDSSVLRRTLQSLEDSIPQMESPINSINELESTNISDVVDKLNEVIRGFNAVVSVFDRTQTTEIQ